jgi:ligand-binding SRPBCC domain-containing protein
MRFGHLFRVRASLAAVNAFHTVPANMNAITRPHIPMRLHRGPQEIVEGNEMDFTMWLGLRLLFARRGWKTRRLLEGDGG